LQKNEIELPDMAVTLLSRLNQAAAQPALQPGLQKTNQVELPVMAVVLLVRLN
jgi:hypothetical protein